MSQRDLRRALNEFDSSANGRLVGSLLDDETVQHYANDTITHNIGYDRPGAALPEIIEVARVAHIHAFTP